MAVHMEIAIHLDHQRKAAVAGKEGQHVVKKADTRINFHRLLGIQVDSQLNLGFKGIAFNACCSHSSFLFFFTGVTGMTY